MSLTVDSATACRIIDKDVSTLKRERARKGTPIKYDYGNTKRKPRYYLSGLIDYLDKKEGVTPEGIIEILKAA